MCEFEYDRTYIEKNDKYEILKVVWPPESKSKAHDHGKSLGWIFVLSGRIYQDVYEKETKQFLHRTYHGPGEMVRETSNIIHVMGNPTGEDAVTAHFYTPPLKMKYYDL